MLFLIVAVCITAINEIGSNSGEKYNEVMNGVIDAREATENSSIE